MMWLQAIYWIHAQPSHPSPSEPKDNNSIIVINGVGNCYTFQTCKALNFDQKLFMLLPNFPCMDQMLSVNILLSTYYK